MLNPLKIFNKIRDFKKILKSAGIDLSTVIYVTVTLVLAVSFSTWITTDIGKKVFEKVLGKVPFAEFIYKIYCNMMGVSLTEPNIDIQDTFPEIGFYSTAVEFSKVLITTPLTAILFRLCLIPVNLISGILAPIQILDGLTDEASKRSIWVDEMEKRLESVSYKGMEATIKALTTFVANWVVTQIVTAYEARLENLDSLITTAIAIGVFIVLFMADSLLFAWRENKNVGAGMLKICFFQLFPKIFTLFCTNIFFFAIYAIFHGSGITPRFIIFTIILFILISFEEPIEKLIQHNIAGILLESGNGKGVTLISAGCSFIAALPLMMTIYLAIFPIYRGVTGSVNSQVQTLKAYPMLDGVVNNLSLYDAVNANGSSFLKTLVKLFFFSLAIVLLLRLPILKDPVVWFAVSIFGSMFVFLYMNLAFEFVFSKLDTLMSFEGVSFTAGTCIWLTIGLIIFLITIYDFYLSLSCTGLTVALMAIYMFLQRSGFLAGLRGMGPFVSVICLGLYALSALLRSIFRDAIMA